MALVIRPSVTNGVLPTFAAGLQYEPTFTLANDINTASSCTQHQSPFTLNYGFRETAFPNCTAVCKFSGRTGWEWRSACQCCKNETAEEEGKAEEMLIPTMIRCEEKTSVWSLPPPNAELRHEDPASFFNFLWVPPKMFDELLARLGPRCTKQDTRYRNDIEPGLKIAVTLRHLASSDKYYSMNFNFRVPHYTIYICHNTRSLPCHSRRVQEWSHHLSNHPWRMAYHCQSVCT